MKLTMLNPIQTKFGVISIETLVYPRSEEDKIKIYDSDDKYLDYFSIEELMVVASEMETTMEEAYVARLKAFREEDNFESLVHLLTTDYIKTTDDPNKLLREKNIECIHNLSDEDYINRIGKHYIVMKD